ncbi:MAG TPA: histidine kinase, partial [Blastocatellia bacterium]|nr:histidine kinase [Blastocatellia bacterium]
MREIAPLLLVGAAAVTFSVALEVFRRASLNTETRLLLLMLSTLGLEYVLLAFASFPIFRETPNELRLHYTAFVAGFVLQILFYGFGSHFIYLTAMRFNALDWSFSPMRTAFGFNRFSDQQFEQWAPFLISYLSAFVAIVMYAVPAAAAIIANSAPVMNRAERSFEFTRGMLWGYDLLWILTQTSILGSIYRRFPAERQKSAIARFIFEDRSGSGMLTRLGLSDREPSLPGDISTTIVMEFRALLTVGAGSVLRAVFTIALFSSAVKPDPSAPITFAYFLLPLLIVLPLIYYKSRFVFFDALIKRGTLAVLLVASAVISLPFAIVPFARAAGPATGLGERFFIAGFCVFFVSTWTGSYGRVERAIDRVLFRRPDYRELLREIGSGLKLFVESGPMIGYVCERLRTGIPAASVDYVAPSSREAKANGPLDAGNSRAAGGNCVVPLTHNNGNYGFLLLGARPHDQPYQSEDIAFLEAVAAHVAAMLHNLELRLERDKQENREAELRELARNAELRALKAQINPHFLFNALNNLADMAGDDPQAAQRTIGDLASVFKFTLESADRESVSLGEESD